MIKTLGLLPLKHFMDGVDNVEVRGLSSSPRPLYTRRFVLVEPLQFSSLSLPISDLLSLIPLKITLADE